jgi:hypothetical protein
MFCSDIRILVSCRIASSIDARHSITNTDNWRFTTNCIVSDRCGRFQVGEELRKMIALVIVCVLPMTIPLIGVALCVQSRIDDYFMII